MQFEPRPLTNDEQRVLGQILDAEFQGVAALREQLAGLQVVGRCDCGCPSIDLEPSSDIRWSDQVGRLAPVELEVKPVADEPPGRVILFVDGGKLSYLEYVYYSEAAPHEWPADNRLERVGPT
ncbi:hypothetical protein BH10ACT8_BH10ACT8_23780 [soil metagenome]